MAEIGELKVVVPKWRIRLCIAVCYVLSPIPMPDRWAARILEGLVAWASAGLRVKVK